MYINCGKKHSCTIPTFIFTFQIGTPGTKGHMDTPQNFFTGLKKENDL